MKVDSDWWKTLFDETYLITDARSVCDEKLTCREVDFVEYILGPKKNMAHPGSLRGSGTPLFGALPPRLAGRYCPGLL